MASDGESAPYQSLEWRDLDKSRFFVINPCVFFVIRTLQHPFNVVKTRFQVQAKHALYASTSSTLVQTLRHEGLRGLYRGFGTSTLMLAVQQLFIVTYEFLRSSDRYSSVQVAESSRNGAAAAAAVLLAQVIANPIDVVAQRLMLQGQIVTHAPMTGSTSPSTVAPVAGAAGGVAAPPVRTGGSSGIPRVLSAVEVLNHVYKSRGMYGFYAGFAVSCAQFIPSASLWWFTYPIYRDALLPQLRSAREEALSGSGDLNPWMALGTLCTLVPPARVAEVMAGSAASATVAIMLNPVDIIRTRVQVEGRSALSVARHLVATEGLKGLWKGTTARIAMLVPQGAMSVWAYEFVKRMSARETPGGDGGAAAAVVNASADSSLR